VFRSPIPDPRSPIRTAPDPTAGSGPAGPRTAAPDIAAQGGGATTKGGAGVVLFVVWIAVSSTVLATLNGIYRTALYAYAAGHEIQWFDQAQLAAAFKPKSGIIR
jgi:hypothetical protein